MTEKIRQIEDFLPITINTILNTFISKHTDTINEVRLRSGQPLCVFMNGKNVFLTQQGEPTSSAAMGYIVTHKEIQDVFLSACKNSVYAYSEQLKKGFLTLSGGHRMAIAGRVVYENANISTMQNITSLSIRIASERKGCSGPLLHHIVQNGQIQSCAIISPPGGGKTTMLRDIARCLSLYGYTVSVIDERGEIAGMNQGIASYDLGVLCDVLDGCKKADGLMMALRGLSPAVMLIDELGSIREAQAVWEGINGGVATIFSLHAATISQAVRREPMKYLLKKNAPDLLVLLSNSDSPGKIRAVYNMRNSEDAEYVANLWNSSA